MEDAEKSEARKTSTPVGIINCENCKFISFNGHEDALIKFWPKNLPKTSCDMTLIEQNTWIGA